jgi:DNA-binding winged helix-turn-helix (wHTH) protein
VLLEAAEELLEVVAEEPLEVVAEEVLLAGVWRETFLSDD